jgi:predicted amidohydrolase
VIGMRAPLSIAAAQPLCQPYDIVINAVAHAAAIRAARARVVAFPELSLTGYELDAPAIRAGDPRLAPIVAACAETGSIALVGAPLSERPASGPYIAMLAVDGDGVTVAYRKMWPSVTEARRFAAGGEPAVLAVDGWRLGLAICRDTGVAQHAADTAALGMDAYVAGVLNTVQANPQAERARRIATEHRVWVVLASFAGSTGGFDEAAGRSSVWGPDGTAVATAGPACGEIVRATLTAGAVR